MSTSVIRNLTSNIFVLLECNNLSLLPLSFSGNIAELSKKNLSQFAAQYDFLILDCGKI